MSSPLEDDFRRVYSILPDEENETAIRDTMKSIEFLQQATTDEILKWAEFEPNGIFLRGGETKVGEGVTEFITDPASDPDIHCLDREATEHGIEPGRIVYNRDRNSFYWFLPTSHLGADSFSLWHLKAFVISERLFARLLSNFNFVRGITPKEASVGFQIVAGLSARDAAEILSLIHI